MSDIDISMKITISMITIGNGIDNNNTVYWKLKKQQQQKDTHIVKQKLNTKLEQIRIVIVKIRYTIFFTNTRLLPPLITKKNVLPAIFFFNNMLFGTLPFWARPLLSLLQGGPVVLHKETLMSNDSLEWLQKLPPRSPITQV